VHDVLPDAFVVIVLSEVLIWFTCLFVMYSFLLAGHVLGIGTLWAEKGLVNTNCDYLGVKAKAEYKALSFCNTLPSTCGVRSNMFHCGGPFLSFDPRKTPQH
jgi:hypothetical protein